MEEDLRALLQGSAAVTALVPQASINWGVHPQGTPWPGLVLNVVSDREDHTLDGPEGLSQGRVQVDAHALSYGAAKRLARAVRTLLNGHKGGSFALIMLDGTEDGGRGDGPTDDARPFRVRADFLTFYNPT